MNLVELELDETLADFEVQDWIDNVFSVQYPDVKARIKKVCSGLCHKKDEWHYIKDKKPKDNEYVLIYTDLKNTYVARIPTQKDYFITNNGGFVQISSVIAWKEIVLPEQEE